MSLQRDNIQLDVTINGTKAGKTLRDLQSDSRSLNRELAQLTPGTEEFIEKSAELQKVNTRLNGIRATTRGGLREIRESADAINTYGEEGGKRIIELRDKSRQLEQQLATLEPTSQEFIDTAKQYAQVNEEITNIEGSVTNLGNEFNNIPGPVGGAIRSIRGLTVAAKAFIATPLGLILGAIAAALGAVRAALTSSEEGQERLNRITTVFSNILGRLNDVLAAVGNALISAFTNPREAIENLADTLRDFLLRRIEQTLAGVRGLGQAVKLFTELKFAEAAKTAGNAFVDLTTGLNPVAGVIRDASGAAKDFVKDLVEVGQESIRVADMRNKATRLERDLLVERAEIEARVSELRLKARQQDQFTAEERAEFLREAAKLQDDLFERENEVLQLRADAIKLENEQSTSRTEDKRAEAEAVAALARSEAQRLNAQRQLQREINTLNNQAAGERRQQAEEEERLQAEELERLANVYKDYLKEIDILDNQQQLELRVRRAQGLLNEEEYQQQLAETQLEGLDQRLEILRAFGREETTEFLQLQAEREELFRDIQDKEREAEEQRQQQRIQARRDTIEAQIREEQRLLREQFLQQLIDEQEFEQLRREAALEAIEDRLEFLAEIGERETEAFRDLELQKLEIEREISDERIKNAEREAAAKEALQQQQLQNVQDTVSASLSILAEEGKERGKQFGAVKAFEAAQIKLNLISEIQKIFNSFASLGPVGQILAVVQAAAAGARAKRALSSLSSINYNTGGQVGLDPLSGQRITQQPNVPTQPGGDNILAYVKRGEVILNEQQQRRLGGARTFRRIGVPGFNTGGITNLNTTPAPVGAPDTPEQADSGNERIIALLQQVVAGVESFPTNLRAKVVLNEFEEARETYEDIEDQANL